MKDCKDFEKEDFMKALLADLEEGRVLFVGLMKDGDVVEVVYSKTFGALEFIEAAKSALDKTEGIL